MKPLLVVISLIGLILTVGPSFAVMSGKITWGTHSSLMFIGMLLWFGTAPFWFKKGQSDSSGEGD